MNRDVPFDKKAVCDGCGKLGAFDFMGDFFCLECIEEYQLINDDEYDSDLDDEKGKNKMIQKIDAKEVDKLMDTGNYGYFCDMGFVPGSNYKELSTDPIIVDGVNGFFIIKESDVLRNGFFIKLSEEVEKIIGGFSPLYTKEELKAFK